MTVFLENILLVWLLFFFTAVYTSSHHDQYTPPDLKNLTDIFPHLNYNQDFKDFWGGSNIKLKDNGSFVNITLDKSSGAGFVSQNDYSYGFFSAAIKLPSGLSSGVVVTLYISNAEKFPHNHDEIDIELLGHENRKEWILQTNIFLNGSVSIGREEKFRLWFDPTQQFHHYSIIWNNHHTVFLVDNVPMREFVQVPSKPMSMYCTIWDGSEWATNGGKDPVNYKYAPFVASFREMQMEGCMWDKVKQVAMCFKNAKGISSLDPVDGEEFSKLSQEQKMGMDGFRKRFMIYSYCNDPGRNKALPPECNR